jgi:phosphoribosylformimino-5-aminoimidazole carboxamide ribotide isomerase
MLIVPAIDLRAGRCVRLLRGDFKSTTSYSMDPADTARAFADAGARWIHVVDLDAAEGKGSDNLAVIGRIRSAVPCGLEVGGGVRGRAQAEKLFELGVDRVVLGTVLVRDPAAAASWMAELGPRFVGGVDAVDGMVKVAGWTESAGPADTEVAASLRGLGIGWLIYTNISRDGTLAGPDIPRTNAAARAAGLPTLLSGGIGSEDDVERVAERKDPKVAGIILGKALYESKVDLGRLFKTHPQSQATAWDLPAGA